MATHLSVVQKSWKLFCKLALLIQALRLFCLLQADAGKNIRNVYVGGLYLDCYYWHDRISETLPSFQISNLECECHKELIRETKHQNL